MTTQKISKSALQNALRRANKAIEELKILKGDYAIQSASENSDDFIIKRQNKTLVRIIRGPKGTDGQQGVQGAPGIKGNRGEKGIKGDQGIKGAQGQRGFPGNRGEKGDTGAVGRSGTSGRDGKDGIQGIRGEKGEQGKIGIRGYPGLQGEKGDSGRDGATGKQGLPGKDGKDGEKGDVGSIPKHQWDGTKLKFQLPGVTSRGNEVWGREVDLQGSSGIDGVNLIGGGPLIQEILRNGAHVGTHNVQKLDFSTDFTISESPGGEINISLSGGAGHALVTLDANADALLSLSTQELGLDTQTKNLIFGGPGSGVDAAPTFRSLVSDDIPTLDHETKLSSVGVNTHTQIDTHMALTNEHIDHTTITLTAGVGLSGGGTIAASRTFTVDLNELTTETTISSGDFISMVDITDSGSGKITFANLESTISHDNISGVSADDHHTESHIISSHSDTTATGAELNTLTDGSETTLHSHAGGGGANTALSNLSAVAINSSLISDTDITDDLGTGDIRWNNAWLSTLNSGLTAADTLKLRGRDVDGAAYVDILTITSNNTVTADLHSSVTINGNAIAFSGGAFHDGFSDFSSNEHFTQANITTVGTISSGTWEATDIGVAHGGTGASTANAGFNALSPVTTRGDLVYRNATVNARLAIGVDGQKLASDGTDPVWEDDIETINFIIDGGGSAITTGIKGDVIVDFACTIQSVTLLADQSGSIVVDIWKDTYANFPPTNADSITASAVPTITTATKSQDATLTGWTTSITAGDILRYNVDSITTCERVTVSLKVKRI